MLPSETCSKVDQSSHGINNKLKLLKELLLHERAEVARHDLLDLQSKSGDLEQGCQHVRLDGRNGGGDHKHRGVGGGGAKLFYPQVDGDELGDGGDTTPSTQAIGFCPDPM